MVESSMFNFLALITNKKYWILHSYMIKLILRIYGIKSGKNFYCEGVPRLKIKGKAKNIIIGDNVSFLGDVDLRNRENGKIILGDNTTIEGDVRIVSARNGTISIGDNSSISAYSILNGGDDIIIGKYCLLSARVSINANEHKYAKNEYIRQQGFMHKPVIIEDDCMIGVNVAINKGVILKKGSVIGSNSVVTKNTNEYSINIGSPTKEISIRK